MENDLLNKQIHSITIIQKISDDYWIGRCSCGNLVEGTTEEFNCGAIKSCGHDSSSRNIIGKKFGKLTVLRRMANDYWWVKCDCGEEKRARGYELIHGRTTSCGVCSKRINLTGRQFGEWTVLSYAGNRKWHCRCSCGKESIVDGAMLRRGTSKSCGHNTNGFKDLTGQIFGHWEVIEYAGDKYWRCKCTKCGSIHTVASSSLKRGQSTQCKICASTKHNVDSMIGRTFGYWNVIDKGTQIEHWLCRCSCGVEKEVHQYSLISGKSTSCGCFGLKTSEQQETFRNREKFIDFIKNITIELGRKPTTYELASRLSVNYNSINRKICGDTEIKLLIHTGSGVPSNKEIELREFIKTLGVQAIYNCRDVIQPYELDIYIPEKKVAIEFNGMYWHSSEFKTKDYHQQKTLLAKSNGIRLIQIYEYEWNNPTKQTKIKELLQEVLTSDCRIVYARKTIVKETTTDEARQFLNRFHLQEYIHSSINLGIYHQDELIGIMSFGKPRFNSKYEYEIIRLAYKNGIKVIGGTEKLFSFFLKKYNPKSVVSYCDLSKFTGNVYSRIGFQQTADSPTRPNYVWVKPGDGNLYTRYQTTKQKLVYAGYGEFGNTEDEIMSSLGYLKVYDSGNLKFEYRRN